VQYVDGKWSPDGATIAVTDVAGQFSLYGTGPPGGWGRRGVGPRMAAHWLRRLWRLEIS
jgi:hypothetical protein